MKNIKNIIKKALLITGSTLLLAACSLNVPPPDQFSDPDAITDVNAGRSLLTSCYQSYPHQEYEFSLLGNDFCPTNLSGKDVETQNLYNWQDKNISNLSATVWPAYYTCISNCDVLLERIDKITPETSADLQEKQAIKAEAQQCAISTCCASMPLHTMRIRMPTASSSRTCSVSKPMVEAARKPASA